MRQAQVVVPREETMRETCACGHGRAAHREEDGRVGICWAPTEGVRRDCPCMEFVPTCVCGHERRGHERLMALDGSGREWRGACGGERGGGCACEDYRGEEVLGAEGTVESEAGW